MFDEDLALFYDTEDFAVDVVLDGETITGVMLNPSIESDFIQSSDPVFSCPTASIPDVSNSSVLITGTKKYRVTAVSPDGTGTTILELRETT